MASSSSSRHNIPVVDMGALGVGKEEDSVSPAEWRRVAQGLCDALSSVGFVYLSNHGIHDQQINEYFNDCASFFKLDEQTKMKYRTAKNVAHGYMDVGREQPGSGLLCGHPPGDVHQLAAKLHGAADQPLPAAASRRA